MAIDDAVFKALADPTRRRLLDKLLTKNGQTLGELCDGLAMARQSGTQHLDILVDANLVTAVRRGREKFHYLNPVPLHELHERWIEKFERSPLDVSTPREPRAIEPGAVEPRAVESTTSAHRPSFVYVTYIEADPDRVWQALTDAELTAAYWGHRNVSDWQVGSRWEHQRTDGSCIADCHGTVLEADPPRRLVTTWEDPNAPSASSTRVTFTIGPFDGIVRLTVTHDDIPDDANRELAASGWAAVLANLKSFLETGRPMLRRPWEMA